MSEYIKKEELFDKTVRRNSIWNEVTNSEGKGLEEIVNDLPTYSFPDSAENKGHSKHGHWKVVSDVCSDGAYICECSECKGTVWVYRDADRKWNYCPTCGADMKLIDEGNREIYGG